MFTVTACSGGPGPQERASNLLSSAAETAESVAAAVGEGLGTPVAEEPETEAPSPSPVPTVEDPRVRRPRQPSRTMAASDGPAAVAPVAVVVDTPVPERAPVPASLVTEAAEVSVEAAVHDSTVYSSADTDVIPPTPPVASGLRPWRNKAGPSVEVTVASDGTVEKVRVIGTTHMSDAMVLSHVKAWKFAPALRDGDPVRYRLLLDDPVVAP